MRIPLTLTLFEKPAPEDHELQISWGVQASANITWEQPTHDQAGELLADDFRIDEVTSAWMTYGTQGSVVVPLDVGTQFGQREGHRALAWLQTQLPDRDDWQELLSNQAFERAPEYLPYRPLRSCLSSSKVAYKLTGGLRCHSASR
jgi:hypothetical protein